MPVCPRLSLSSPFSPSLSPLSFSLECGGDEVEGKRGRLGRATRGVVTALPTSSGERGGGSLALFLSLLVRSR